MDVIQLAARLQEGRTEEGLYNYSFGLEINQVHSIPEGDVSS